MLSTPSPPVPQHHPASSPARSRLAATTPEPTEALAAGASAAAKAAAGSSAPSARAATAAAKAAAIQSFVHVVLHSPLVKAALLALEVEGLLGRDLQQTLAQLLVLHLKAGYESASEVQLLALLWTLEAWADSSRSRCSEVLYSYLEYLDLYDPQRALVMAAHWRVQFTSLRRSMANSQMELLKRLGWRMTLDAQLEVAPCGDILFSPNHEFWELPPQAIMHQASTSSAHHMCTLVSCIQRHAAELLQARRPASS